MKITLTKEQRQELKEIAIRFWQSPYGREAIKNSREVKLITENDENF